MTFEDLQIGMPVIYTDPGKRCDGLQGEVTDIKPHGAECVKVFFPRNGSSIFIFDLKKLTHGGVQSDPVRR